MTPKHFIKSIDRVLSHCPSAIPSNISPSFKTKFTWRQTENEPAVFCDTFLGYKKEIEKIVSLCKAKSIQKQQTGRRIGF